MIRIRLSRLAAASGLMATLCSPAMAQTSSSAPAAISGVTVVAPAKEPPKVISTYPAAGKSVQPGALILTVTFDQRMNPDGWDYAKGQDRYPQCLARPRLLNDQKTFVLLCTAGGNQHFSVQFNATPSGGFENLAGQHATPSAVDFITTEGASLSTIDEAMKAAGLKPDQGPVMDDKPATALASTATPSP